MSGIRTMARAGLLAAGLGVGAALAATPGVASADSSADPWSWLAGLDPFPAAGASTLDFQISIDGYDLIPAADTSATATSGMGDIAIAFGNGSIAQAGAGSAFGETLTPGFFDIAVANGDGSSASAGQGNFDSAFADGTSSTAAVGGFNGVSSNGDWAAAFGSHTNAESGVFGSVPSENDGALVFDPFGTLGSTADAGDGNSDFASVFGDNSTALAGGGSAVTNSGDLPGNFDFATVFGNSSDATAGSTLTAPGDFDLAAVFGDMLHSTAATGGNYLVDILPTL
jgi:hypothetical protein